MLSELRFAILVPIVFGVQWSASICFADARNQNFSTDPGWTTVGSGANGNNFGYQAATANAGGSVGEGGGTFTRGTTGRIYADTNLGGAFSLNLPFSASGKFDYTAAAHPDFGPALAIGHFLSVGNPLTGNLSQIGIGFGSDGPDKLRWTVFVSVGSTQGGQALLDAPPGPVSYIDPNIDRTWSYSWNPTGGVNGGGTLTGSLSGPGGGTRTLDLTQTQRATLAPASVNAFGISVSYPSQSTSAEFANIFIDDVSYSIANSTFLLGDFNRDNHVNFADIPVMLSILADVNPYKNILQYTNSQLLSIEDMNGDGKFTNADVQGLLSYLKAGGGSVAAVPEPTSIMLVSTGVGMFLVLRGPGGLKRRI